MLWSSRNKYSETSGNKGKEKKDRIGYHFKIMPLTTMYPGLLPAKNVFSIVHTELQTIEKRQRMRP